MTKSEMRMTNETVDRRHETKLRNLEIKTVKEKNETAFLRICSGQAQDGIDRGDCMHSQWQKTHD